VERVEIHDVSRIAFNPHEQTTDLVIRGCVAHHNSWDGFIGDFVSNAVYENNVAYANDRHGFNIVTHSHDTVVRGNVAYDNAESGIVVQRGGGSKSIEGWEALLNRDVLVENNLVYGNKSFGILLKQTELCQIVNNIVHHNGMSGIRIEGAHDNLVAGNTVTDEAQGIEVTRYPGSLPGPDESYGNVILGNLLDRMAEAIQESGTTTTDNLYTDNVVLAGTIQINPGSILDDDAVVPVFDKIEVALNFPTIDGKTYGGVTLYGTEGSDLLVGNNGDDTMYGQDGNDTLVGNRGNDVLKGRDDNDTLQGGDGSDELYGGQNDDRLEGGNGADFLYGDDLVTPGGNDMMSGGAGNDLMKGRFGDDTMYGDDGDDKMWGGEGTDLLYGGAGVDALYGGEGNDVLSGGAGADKLSGEEGNDILAGGAGVDSLYGGL
ncbi:MAG TPA: right-handed parallel beta-helix repeat-containing protein, partial [Alphaproteobacteria bacterium]|nr:right-handed parallel beta-helix repeat-containing protein [Alphaproteobacteria bacterium]